MTVKLSIKVLVIFTIIIVIGFWILTKVGDNKSVTSSENVLTGETREIEVTARQFSFEPNPIKVKLGEMVNLKIKSIDVVHGFALPEFGINEVLEPGRTVTVEFQATQRGNFQFLCSVSCGIGHSGMRGTLVVE